MMDKNPCSINPCSNKLLNTSSTRTSLNLTPMAFNRENTVTLQLLLNGCASEIRIDRQQGSESLLNLTDMFFNFLHYQWSKSRSTYIGCSEEECSHISDSTGKPRFQVLSEKKVKVNYNLDVITTTDASDEENGLAKFFKFRINPRQKC